MALTSDEIALLERHRRDLHSTTAQDLLMAAYADGEQALSLLGMAVPGEAYERLAFAVQWPGMFVEQIESRQDVRALILPGDETADPRLAEAWDANNLDADLSMFLWDRYVYGRAFMSCGSNEDDASMPLLHVESPREMSAFVDVRQRRMTSAAKFYGVDPVTRLSPTNATLYMPDYTLWIQRDSSTGKWAEVDRDVHGLGRVPVVMSLSRRRSGSTVGRPLVTKVNDIADGLARTMANMAFASEAAGIPRIGAIGMARGDFVGEDGKQLPKWAAYYNAIWATGNKEAKFHQFSAADMKNFETQVNVYGRLAASVTYLPARYFGITSVNPASEGAIDAEEAQFVKFVQRQNAQVGSVLGWAAALWLRFSSGEWVDGSRINVEWHNPGTPTISQREDALGKRRAAGVLSREGYWDELGWSEARKAKERAYFESEAVDPFLSSILRPVDAPLGD